MYCEMVSYIGAVLEFVTKITFYDASVTAIYISFESPFHLLCRYLVERSNAFQDSLNSYFFWTHD